ncbi:MAG: hypothetical protein AMS22_15485 [Thiotrichales bacterium SG8_50]|nr:MAG: hypothetical protein AMS22_15485 [Thiotrichales bacterium SG8_50]
MLSIDREMLTEVITPVVAVLGLAVATIGVVLVLNSQHAMGTIDATRLVKTQLLQLEKEIAKAQTEKQREAIATSATQFGQRMNQVIEELARECKCMMVHRRVALSSSVPDYTEEALRRLGL